MNDQTTDGLKAAIRAAKLALFVIRKQGVVPNSSWEAGFEKDLKTAEDALAAVSSGIRKSEYVCRLGEAHCSCAEFEIASCPNSRKVTK